MYRYGKQIISKNFTSKRFFNSQIFPNEKIQLSHTTENVIRGGSNRFPLLSEGFHNIKKIGIIGWGSQGPSQALNLRDSLNSIDSPIDIKIGLRPGSKSIPEVIRNNFEYDTMENVLQESDFNIILISDSAQVKLYPEIFSNIKEGSTIGFSHGFLLGHLQNVEEVFPDNINVVMMAPKGMGPTLRDKYLLDSGINSSVAIQQNINNKAEDIALSWAIGVGSPYVFHTTMEQEYISDIFGERAILLGGIHGLVEYLFRNYLRDNCGEKDSYYQSVVSLTGPINNEISWNGLLNLYHKLLLEDKIIFRENYHKSYHISKVLFEEIYREVKCGNEIRSVVINGDIQIGKIDNSHLWQVAKGFEMDTYSQSINAKTAGMYIGAMMAQVDILLENGHCYSEIVNESIIEATDSLNPYMYQKGISHMIDNCSITARLGARKWASRLDYLYEQNMDTVDVTDSNFDSFLEHPIHSVLEELYKFKS